MTVELNNRKFELKFQFECDIMFETYRGKSFMAKTETDWLFFFYTYYLQLTQDFELSFDDFLLLLNEKPWYLPQFVKWYTDWYDNNMKFIQEDEDKSKKD